MSFPTRDRDNLLDTDDHPVWGKYVRGHENILWEGRPSLATRLSFLEEDAYYDVATGFSSMTILYMVMVFVVARAVYGEYGLTEALPMIVFGLGMGVLSDLLRNKSDQRTRYAVTEHYLLFRFDYFLWHRVRAIPLTEVISVAPINGPNGSESLLFPNHHPNRIVTRDLIRGKIRDHASFELIEDGAQVRRLIVDLIADNKLPPLTYEYKKISNKTARRTRIVYRILAVLTLLYIADFYFSPTRTISDRVDKTIVKAHATGALHHTANGLSFSTDNVYHFHDREANIEITYSLVFKSVKRVITYRKDYTDRLDGDLHALGKYGVFACLLTFLAGTLILRRSEVSTELYTQLLVCTVFFLILLWVLNRVL